MLSSWMLTNQNDNRNAKSFDYVPNENTGSGRIVGDMDKPIIRMVIAYWNEAEPSHVSP